MIDPETRVQRDGRVMLPAGIRRALNIKDGDLLAWSVSDAGQLIARRA